MKGKTNVYVCRDCGVATVTIDRDEGVTPFMIGCRLCDGTAESSFYRNPHGLPPSHEWYKPGWFRSLFLHRLTREHVRKGGLILREIRT